MFAVFKWLHLLETLSFYKHPWIKDNIAISWRKKIPLIAFCSNSVYWGGEEGGIFILSCVVCQQRSCRPIAWGVGHCSNIKEGAVRYQLGLTTELYWTDPEEESCFTTCVLYPKRDFWIFPTTTSVDFLCSVSPKGNHQSSKRRKSFLDLLANSIFPILL